MHLEAAIGRVVVAAGPLVDVGARLARRSAWSRPSSDGRSSAGGATASPSGKPAPSRARRSSRASRPSDASSGWPTNWADCVVLAGDGSAGAVQRRERVPQGRRGLREVEVHVAALAESPHQLDLGGRQPRVPEQ